MILLPYEKLTYISPLKKDDAIKRLFAKIDPNPPFLNWKFGELERPFKGTMYENKFIISKILSNSGISLPYFFGEIIQNEEGSTILITIKPRTSRIIFSALFYSLFLFIGLIVIIISNSIWPQIAFPLGVLLFSYSTTTMSFKFQASFIKDDLMEIFEVKEI